MLPLGPHEKVREAAMLPHQNVRETLLVSHAVVGLILAGVSSGAKAVATRILVEPPPESGQAVRVRRKRRTSRHHRHPYETSVKGLVG